jgi:Ca2+-binding RTX toxin-like protein
LGHRRAHGSVGYNGSNTLKLGSGLTPANVLFQLSANGADLLITDEANGDLITLKNQYINNPSGYGYNQAVQTLVYGNGVMQNLLTGITLTESGNGTFGGTPFGDTLVAGVGIETFSLAGNLNEVYSYATGHGSLTIIHTPAGGPGSVGYNGSNTLRLGVGLTAAGVLFQVAANGSDLLITDDVTGDLITLKNQLINNPSGYGYNQQVQSLIFGDGSTLNLSGLAPIIGRPGTNTSGTTGNDLLIGGGTGTLTGNGGNDTFIAATGAETLAGGTGNDTYSYAAGVGNITIVDAGGTNTLRLAPGLTSSNALIAVSGTGSDLLLSDGTNGDLITIKGQFGTGSHPVQNLVFGDGGTLNLMGALKINAWSGGAFSGTANNDTLYGGTGTETLSGGGGADTFIAGSGAETLIGSAGNDYYSCATGSGQDTIVESGGTDTLQLGSGIAIDQISFQHTNNDLVVTRIGTTDTLTIEDWYSGSSDQIETFRTSDGHVLASTQVANLVNAMASYSPPALGQTALPSDYASALEPVITSNWS